MHRAGRAFRRSDGGVALGRGDRPARSRRTLPDRGLTGAPAMRIIIVTDAWSPQVNGVVRTPQTMQAELERMGHEVKLISPDLFGSIPCPTYPEIRLAFARSGLVGRNIAGFRPDAIPTDDPKSRV